jgi:PEP-CTERM motif
MQLAKSLLSAAALTLLSASAFAATTVYTTSASFLTNVAPGAYFNNFDGLLDPPVGAVPFSGGGFGYSASAPSDIYLEGGFLGASEQNEALTISFTTGNVTAFGANFFATDFVDDFQSVSITLTLSDGTTVPFTPTSAADSFRGFVSTSPITSLVFSGPGASLYAGLDNFTVGAAAPVVEVPEPTSLALVGLGIAGLFAARRRAA